MTASAIQRFFRGALRACTRPRWSANLLRQIFKHDFIPETLIEHFPVECTFSAGLPGDKKPECRFLYQSTCGDALGRLLFWKGWRAWGATGRVYYELCKSSTVVLDAGANTGIFTLAACAANPSCTVTAIEPVKRVFDRLRRNIELNGWGRRVVLVQKAVSDTCGTASMSVPEQQIPCMATLAASGPAHGTAETVVTCTLDSLEGMFHSLDLTKIDVEGAEYRVLKGMEKLLKRFRPALVLEYSVPDSGPKITSLLKGFGYRFFRLGLEAISEEPGLGGKIDARAPDWLCCAESHLDRLRGIPIRKLR
jgi:FkbM family methyltransferase